MSTLYLLKNNKMSHSHFLIVYEKTKLIKLKISKDKKDKNQ